jgi:3-deoxy-D-manno-octulosonate 8-phosphate phosphatase (KDO 8-P phosphatase)
MAYQEEIFKKAALIRLVLTDVDGVLTDTGVYYSDTGELMKRFSIRDGMGVERLRNIGIKTGIITGERSGSVSKRAEKLKITELHLGISDKPTRFKEILSANELLPSQVAYIGDDYNDLEMLKMVGLSAAPFDAMPEIAAAVDFHCTQKGGNGAFREFAELIIGSQNDNYE